MGDQNRKAKRSKYQGLGEEETQRKRQRNNELERERHHEKQRLFDRLDQVLPEEFKTSLHKPGSQTSILENAINFVIAKTEREVGNPANQEPQSVVDYVSSASCVSSDKNEDILQPNQQMVQQPQLNVTGAQLPMQCQPPVLLMNQPDIQQMAQPNLAETSLNHLLQPTPKPNINSFPVTTVTADAQTQQMQIMPLNDARLNFGHQSDKMPHNSHSVSTQLISVPHIIPNQSNYSMPITACPKQKFVRKSSQKRKQRVLMPKSSSSNGQGSVSPVMSSTESPLETAGEMINQQLFNANNPATISPLRQSSPQVMPNFNTAMSNQHEFNANAMATTSLPQQSSYQAMPNFHATMSSQQQFNSHTPAATSFPRQSSHQVMPNFHTAMSSRHQINSNTQATTSLSQQSTQQVMPSFTATTIWQQQLNAQTPSTSSVPHESSHQVMPNLYANQTCDFPSPLDLPVPEENVSLGILDDLDDFFNSVPDSENRENGPLAANLGMQGIPENNVAQANYDMTSYEHTLRQAVAESSEYHTAQEGLEIKHNLPIVIPGNEISLRPEDEKENRVDMNIDCTNRPDSLDLLSHPLFMDPY